jgi:uncharacterized protein YPO0396
MTLQLDIDGLESASTEAQWRLSRVEVVNWGTFDGHHRAEIGRSGHLITGASGSGKSSLLDAIATVLTPRRWLRFNAAAHDTGTRGDDRTLVSYVRGAWRRQTDDETGDTVATYLRAGATWSAVLLRYDRQDADAVNLIRLFHIKRGTNANGDINELHVIRRGDVDLLAFAPYVQAGIDKRRIDAAWSDVFSAKEHSPFGNRYRRLLGIGSESAVQLLHKTQSAKNLGSLDQLFRGFMLDEPQTFGMARTAVEQFEALSNAHRLVVEARRQVEALQKLSAPATRYDAAVATGSEADRLHELVEDFQDLRMLALARTDHARARERLAERRTAASAAEDRAAAARDAHLAAQQQALALGGSALEGLRLHLDAARDRGSRVAKDRAQLESRLRAVGVPAPATAEDFEQLRITAARDAASQEGDSEARRTRLDALNDARTRAQTRIAAIDADLRELRNRRSNIPGDLTRARSMILDAVGLPEEALPFAGELIDVRPDQAEWAGAINRVLRPLSTVMLVRDDHLAAVSSVIERLHLGARLVYEAVPFRVDPPRAARSAASLITKIAVSEGPSAAWLQRHLSERFDYECVDDVDDLRATERGVTRAGQVKRGARRYEKDDRARVDDRRTWVLGSDNNAKVEALLDERRARSAEGAEAVTAITTLEQEVTATTLRLAALRDLVSVDWADVDLDAASALVELRQQQYDELATTDAEFGAAQAREREARDRERAAEQERRDTASAFDEARRDVASLETTVAELEARESTWTIAPEDVTALEARYHRFVRSLTRATLGEVTLKVTKELSSESKAAQREADEARALFERLATAFCLEWRSASADLHPEIGDRQGFAQLRDRIISTGLPDQEARFFDLLRTQSQQLTGSLLATIRQTLPEVRSRIEPVNASLLRSPFDAERYLQIQVKDHRTPEVRDFMDDLRTVSAGSWSEDDREAAEERFVVLQTVMRRLGADEHAGWRQRVLDTRQHVTFVGVEQDAEGVERNRYESGAGLSGGQKQKLVIFCLAAALRYQLAEDEHDVPAYGTIILDEAFDKADSTFTRMAMDVFLEFGFHMVLATPLKLLQTLEPYVDGVSYVVCHEHKDSRIGTVPLEREAAG